MSKRKEHWFHRCMRQVHMDFHMPEFPAEAIDSFDAKAFVANLVRGKIALVSPVRRPERSAQGVPRGLLTASLDGGSASRPSRARLSSCPMRPEAHTRLSRQQ